MKSIGLKRKTVKLVKHRASWSKAFQQEKKKISKVLGREVLDIQHIGSTAISKIPAKPVIDIVVGVNSIKNIKNYSKKLKTSGYIYRPNFRRPDQHLLFAKGDDVQRTHHIHIVKHDGAVWRRLILFRDYLNEHPASAKQYANLKKNLAKHFAYDRRGYTLAKKSFISDTLKKAKNKL